MRTKPTLRLAAFLALVATTTSVAPAEPAPSRPEHVVLVVLGGGVRAREMLGRPDLCPTIRAIGAAGFASDGWAAAGSDPTDATKGILTGRTVPVATPGRMRSAFPTLLEYARKGLALSPEGGWYASYADGEALELAASDHADFGAAFAPSVAAGEGPFGDRLRTLFRLFGRPNPTSERTWGLLAGLRSVTAKEGEHRLATTSPVSPEESMRIERVLLEEVDRRSQDYAGPAGLDARAMRAAGNVLRLFRPRLVVVRLGQADAASKSLAAYWDVLKRDDAELARLRSVIAADPVLRSTTAFLVVGDVGRDANLNAAGALDRSDGSPDATTVAVVGEGPGLARGVSLKAPRDVRDLVPTIGRLLGFPTPYAEGKVREELLSKR